MHPDAPSVGAPAPPAPPLPDEPPPILGTWRRMYGLVLLTLLAVVIFLAVLTWVYK